MAHLRFRKYTHKHTGEPQYDPVDSDGIGGLFQKDIDETIKAGHTVEIVNNYQAPVSGIADLDDLLKDASDEAEARGYIEMYRDDAVSKLDKAKMAMMESLESTPKTASTSDEALVRFAGDYTKEKNFERLLARAQSMVDAEDAGLLKLKEDGFASYGEKEALAEQAGRIKQADVERYAGDVPYLVSRLNSPDSTSVTAEQVRNKALLEGRKLKNVPTDDFAGKDVRKNPGEMGIDGEFKDDSTVRVHTKYGNELDPLTGTPVIERMPVKTEFMSQGALQDLYKKVNNNGMFGIKDVQMFNQFLAEYYGQQGLKLDGMRPVADKDRAFHKVKGRNIQSPTVGTDRLIELAAKFSDDEIKRAKDYRYLNENGEVTVGDSQTFSGPRIGLEVINNSKLTDTQNNQFRNNLVNALRKEDGTIDEAIVRMLDEGQAGRLQQTYDGVKRYGGIRVGKALSKSPKLGSGNVDKSDIRHQYGADEILYQNLPDAAANKLGVVPSEMILVDTAKANKYLGNPDVVNNGFVFYPSNRMGANGYPNKGKMRVDVDKNELINAGAARRLDPEIVRQLQQ